MAVSSLSHTETMVLDGLGYNHRAWSIPELAERLEVSVASITPHLDSLVTKGRVYKLLNGRYRRV